MKGTTICHRNGKANGESNKDEQAEKIDYFFGASILTY